MAYIVDRHLRCPLCGAGMTLQTNRGTGEYFYGCVRYADSQCRGTRDISEGKGKTVRGDELLYCVACGERRSLNSRGLCSECRRDINRF